MYHLNIQAQVSIKLSFILMLHGALTSIPSSFHSFILWSSQVQLSMGVILIVSFSSGGTPAANHPLVKGQPAQLEHSSTMPTLLFGFWPVASLLLFSSLVQGLFFFQLGKGASFNKPTGVGQVPHSFLLMFPGTSRPLWVPSAPLWISLISIVFSKLRLLLTDYSFTSNLMWEEKYTIYSFCVVACHFRMVSLD